jgi:hypothetical protein
MHLDEVKLNSETSRKTNFKLGDHKNLYLTTTNEQNKLIEGGRVISASKESNAKNDLRKSHFILGNYEPNFKTISQTEYYNKSRLQNSAPSEGKSIEKQLREHNYILGNHKPDYKSETHSKYLIPSKTGRSQQTISTHDLQKSHHVFGNFENPWTTTSQTSYFSKDVENKKYSKDLTKTNFVLGEDRPDFKSISQSVYVPLGLVKNDGTQERSNDLRSKI